MNRHTRQLSEHPPDVVSADTRHSEGNREVRCESALGSEGVRSSTTANRLRVRSTSPRAGGRLADARTPGCPQHVQAGRSQHFAQSNHRKSEQCGRVISSHALEERTPESLRPKAARTVIRPLLRYVCLDVVCAQRPELDRERNDVGLDPAAGRIEHPQSRYEIRAISRWPSPVEPRCSRDFRVFRSPCRRAVQPDRSR